MPYIPNSAVTVLESLPGEFVYADTNKSFLGKYIKTKDNKFYAGEDWVNLGPRLRRATKSLKTFGQTRNVKVFNVLKESLYEKNKKHINIEPSKNIPTESDYKRGYFNRYYLIRSNDPSSVFEINEKEFQEIYLNKKHDHNLYNIGSIKWALEGDVVKINYETLLKKKRENPAIKGIFYVFNKLDEFYKPPAAAAEDITAYNIPDRYYPDNNGEPGELIPNNLPPSYAIPQILNQKCGSCAFFKNNMCRKWKANVRQGYWCKSWVVNIDTYLDIPGYSDYLQSTLNPDSEIDYSYRPRPTTLGGNVSYVNQNLFPPFGIEGDRVGQRRIRIVAGIRKQFRWDGERWNELPPDFNLSFGDTVD